MGLPSSPETLVKRYKSFQIFRPYLDQCQLGRKELSLGIELIKAWRITFAIAMGC